MGQIIITFVLERSDVALLRTIRPSLTMSSMVESVAALTPRQIEGIIRQHVVALVSKAQPIAEVG